jgi:hypothetical protein
MFMQGGPVNWQNSKPAEAETRSTVSRLLSVSTGSETYEYGTSGIPCREKAFHSETLVGHAPPLPLDLGALPHHSLLTKARPRPRYVRRRPKPLALAIAERRAE